MNFSLSLKSKIFTLLIPSTKTLTVPSGNFNNCKTLPKQPKEYRSFSSGSSISEFFWVTKTIDLSSFGIDRIFDKQKRPEPYVL